MTMETPANERLLPLSQLAKYSPYSAEYLSLRARQGKLRAKKINGAWHSSLKDIQDYQLQQANFRLQTLKKLKSGVSDSISDTKSAKNNKLLSRSILLVVVIGGLLLISYLTLAVPAIRRSIISLTTAEMIIVK